MSQAKDAIRHLRKTGNVEESVDIVLGRRKPLYEQEAKQQTQEWFFPNQDAYQQFILRVADKLPEASYTAGEYSNGSQGGYKVTVSGVFNDSALASLAAVHGGSVRLDGPSSDLT